MTPLTVEHPPNKLLDLVSKVYIMVLELNALFMVSVGFFELMCTGLLQGLAMERDEASKGIAPTPLYDSSMAIPAGYGSIPPPQNHTVDFRLSKYYNFIVFSVFFFSKLFKF